MIRLALRVRREQAEIALAELLELAPGGVEESECDAQTVEYAVYGAPGELPELPTVQALVGGALVDVSASEVADDWHERWKRFHRPVTLASPAIGDVPALHLRPPWEPSLRSERTEDLVIDPGQAFGTGSHATTKLCLELLLELAAAEGRGSLLDVGTGSGVLAIAAAKLGFAPVLAFDYDPESVRAARENALLNGVEVEVAQLDLRRDDLPPTGGSTLLANLLRPLLLDLAARMSHAPRDLILSGLLEGEVEEVAGVFAARHGLRERLRRQEGEWAATWLSSRR